MLEESTIFVLTNTPHLYGNDLNRGTRTPVFIKKIDDLLTKLKCENMAGLVLEIDKVMKASRQERDRLFEFSSCFPMLRTRANTRNNFITYLDHREPFFANMAEEEGKRRRNHERKVVDMECFVSMENDPSMAEALPGVVRDISPGGCFIQFDRDLTPEHFINLRIPQLSSPRPIFSSIRWTRCNTDPQLCGMGVMFIDPTEDQVKEIEAIQE